MANQNRHPRIVWNAAGLSSELTGIERLAVSYSSYLRARAPEVEQVFIAERQYRWLTSVAESATIRFVPHVPATVLVPRPTGPLRASAWHSWANPLLPARGIARHFSFTVHDWTPFEKGTMRTRHKFLWRAALLANLRLASAVHFTTQHVFESTPQPLLKTLAKKQVLIGGDVPTLPLMRGSQPTEPYVISIGTFIPRKRFAELVELWSTVRLRDAPTLVIVGRGTEKLGQGANHRGLGYVEDSELAQLISGSTAALSFSDREGLNLPAREALRAGVPVIGTAGALGTTSEASGVHVVDVNGWSNLESIASDVHRSLVTCEEARRTGAIIGHDLTDGETLADFLIDRAYKLSELH